MITTFTLTSLQSCPVSEGDEWHPEPAGVPEPIHVPGHSEQDPRHPQGEADGNTLLRRPAV